MFKIDGEKGSAVIYQEKETVEGELK